MMPIRETSLAQPTRQREAILARQTHIEKHEGWKLALHYLAQRRAPICSAHAEALLAYQNVRSVIHPFRLVGASHAIQFGFSNAVG